MRLTVALSAALIATFVTRAVQGQSPSANDVPEQFEFFEGHAYMGSESVKWEHDKLVVLKRVASMEGDGAFRETREELSPRPEAWQRFWARVDSLDVWQWKSDYSDPNRNMPDGESWAVTLRCRGKQQKSKGYNAVPPNYGEFRTAVYKLMEDARHYPAK